MDRAHDPDIWSARVNNNLRIIFHKKRAVILLLYAGYHEDAYEWARRRRVETNATTGVIQLVTVREAVEDIAPRQNEEKWKRQQTLFEGLSRQDLLSAAGLSQMSQSVEKVVIIPSSSLTFNCNGSFGRN